MKKLSAIILFVIAFFAVSCSNPNPSPATTTSSSETFVDVNDLTNPEGTTESVEPSIADTITTASTESSIIDPSITTSEEKTTNHDEGWSPLA